jgi:hypothetical protein
MAVISVPNVSPHMGKETEAGSARPTTRLSRRKLLVGTAATTLAGTSAPTDMPGGPESDSELMALEGRFRDALDTYEVTRRHFNGCEERYFDLCPSMPKTLTRHGRLGHLLVDRSMHWSTGDLRRMLKNPEHRDVWDDAQAALAVARAYAAEVRKARRASGVVPAEAAQNEALAAISDTAGLILAAPARSLAGLAVKARIVKTWGQPEWWDPVKDRADQYERLAAQVLDAVMMMASGRSKQPTG